MNGGTMRGALAALLAVTALAKLSYVFALTDYPNYLTGDFGGYWYRALARIEGDPFDTGQWAIWPPLAHILLSWYLQAVDLLGFSRWRLEAMLVANVAMSTASTALVYGIAAQTLQRKTWALGVAALYACSFPLIYFNAFIMSEHAATLCMLAALWLALLPRQHAPTLVAAGALLGLACAQRPALGLFGVAFFAYLAAGERPWRTALERALLFSVGFVLIVVAAAFETQRISGGRVAGLGANGGMTFFFSQCGPRELLANHDGEGYQFIEPALADRPEHGSAHFLRPLRDQPFFTGLAWECLREQPDPLYAARERFRNLFFGPLLPTVASAWGIVLLLPVFRWFLLACTLALPLAFAVRGSTGVRRDALALQGGILSIAALTLYIFPAEHRFLYPLLGPLYVVCAAVLLAATREPRRMGSFTLAWVGALGALLLGSAALRGMTTPPVSATVHPALDTFSLRALRYEKPEPLAPQRPGEAEAYVVFRTCMDLREAGVYEFRVVSQEGYALSIDDAVLLDRRRAGMEAAFAGRRQLAPGKHAFAIRGDRAFGLRATWRRIASPKDEWRPGLGLHYIGESAGDLEFLPPERCSGAKP
jgi:hypothetical protein